LHGRAHREVRVGGDLEPRLGLRHLIERPPDPDPAELELRQRAALGEAIEREDEHAILDQRARRPTGAFLVHVAAEDLVRDHRQAQACERGELVAPEARARGVVGADHHHPPGTWRAAPGDPFDVEVPGAVVRERVVHQANVASRARWSSKG
jgi:hypothetical protein